MIQESSTVNGSVKGSHCHFESVGLAVTMRHKQWSIIMVLTVLLAKAVLSGTACRRDRGETVE